MPRFLGVGARIAERLLALGYRRPDGKPDVARFCRDKTYDPRLFYEWLGDRANPTKDIARLVQHLEVSHSWLLFGAPPEQMPDRPPATAAPTAPRMEKKKGRRR